MPIDVICTHVPSLCELSRGIAGEINLVQPIVHFQPMTFLSFVIALVPSALISVIARFSFVSLFRLDAAASLWLFFIVFAGAGMFVFGPSELAILIVIKVSTFCLLAVLTDDMETLTKVGLLSLVAVLFYVARNHYHGQALPIMLRDLGVAAFCCFLFRLCRYLPYLPWLMIWGVVILILHRQGLGTDIVSELIENLTTKLIR